MRSLEVKVATALHRKHAAGWVFLGYGPQELSLAADLTPAYL
jgi:hypothetical protein